MFPGLMDTAPPNYFSVDDNVLIYQFFHFKIDRSTLLTLHLLKMLCIPLHKTITTYIKRLFHLYFPAKQFFFKTRNLSYEILQE